MIEKTYLHISGSDGLPLSVLRIEPDNAEDIKGIVQMIHGKNEHKQRYSDFMRFLAENGYIAVIHDNRGHGDSVRGTDDLGYMYGAGIKGFLDDIFEITEETKGYARQRCGDRRLSYTLLGHSMGSLAARCYLIEHDLELDRLCVLGSPSWKWQARPGARMVRGLKRIEGGRSRSPAADYLIMRKPYARLDKREDLHNAWTNSDREAVIERNADPLCRYKFTLDGFDIMTGLTVMAYKKSFTAQNPDLKIRFFSGENDPVMVSRHKLWEAVMLLKKRGYTDVTGKIYRGMRHDLLNEKNKQRVYRDILDFIEK